MAHDDILTIGDRSFRSRLLVGTGKYRTPLEMTEALAASGAEVVTVAVRRVDLNRDNREGILHHLDPTEWFLLANTAGCYTADEAMRYARLGREAGFNEFVKLEVIGDRETLLPDTAGLLEATRTLAAEGWSPPSALSAIASASSRAARAASCSSRPDNTLARLLRSKPTRKWRSPSSRRSIASACRSVVSASP